MQKAPGQTGSARDDWIVGVTRERFRSSLRPNDCRLLEMPSGFDDFSERAHRGFTGAGASAIARRNAARLEAAMTAQGFAPFTTEWWHFDGPGWEQYELLDTPLD